MTTYASPPPLSSSHTANASQTTILPPDLNPSSLDTLPVLTSILARLQTTDTPHATSTSSPHHSQPLTHSLSQSQLTQPTSSPSFGPSQATAASTTAPHDRFSTAPLSTKDVPSATDALKHRLQRARAQVAALPDVARGVAEQEQEIKGLEERIREQRGVLETLRALGARGGADGDGDSVMLDL